MHIESVWQVTVTRKRMLLHPNYPWIIPNYIDRERETEKNPVKLVAFWHVSNLDIHLWRHDHVLKWWHVLEDKFHLSLSHSLSWNSNREKSINRSTRYEDGPRCCCCSYWQTRQRTLKNNLLDCSLIFWQLKTVYGMHVRRQQIVLKASESMRCERYLSVILMFLSDHK